MTFDQWFKMQFGRLPLCGEERAKLVDKKIELSAALRAVESTLNRDSEIELAYRAAAIREELGSHSLRPSTTREGRQEREGEVKFAKELVVGDVFKRNDRLYVVRSIAETPTGRISLRVGFLVAPGSSWPMVVKPTKVFEVCK